MHHISNGNCWSVVASQGPEPQRILRLNPDSTEKSIVIDYLWTSVLKGKVAIPTLKNKS